VGGDFPGGEKTNDVLKNFTDLLVRCAAEGGEGRSAKFQKGGNQKMARKMLKIRRERKKSKGRIAGKKSIAANLQERVAS